MKDERNARLVLHQEEDSVASEASGGILRGVSQGPQQRMLLGRNRQLRILDERSEERIAAPRSSRGRTVQCTHTGCCVYITTCQTMCMTNTIAYCRVSTDEQTISLDMQQATLRAYCTMRNLNLVEVITDTVSAGKPLSSRDGGRRLLDMVRRKKVDAVVAYKLDRLFRDCGDCLQVTRQWEQQGVALHLVDLGGQAVDTSSATGRFFLTVIAGAAEMERNLIRERTRAALQHRRTNRKRTGQIPYGYQLASDGESLEPLQEEQEVLSLIMQMRQEGKTLRAITTYLNSNSIPSRGKRWHLTTVARIATGQTL